MKKFNRIIAVLLLLCAVVSLAPQKAYALPADDLIFTAPEEETPVPAPAPQRLGCLVRYGAGYGYLVIGCLENGARLTVLGTYGEFYRIDCYDMTGYIAINQVEQRENGEYYVNCAADSSETKLLQSFAPQEALALRGQIRELALTLQGVPYVTGGTGKWGFDCCGFTQYVYNSLGFDISRTVAAQLEDGMVISKDDLQCGDLIFFSNTTGWGHFASHVGLYIGNGKMIHSGEGGVAVVDFAHPYYQTHYMCARRVILSDVTTQTVLPSIGINQNINSSYWRENSQTDSGLGNSFAGPIAYI